MAALISINNIMPTFPQTYSTTLGCPWYMLKLDLLTAGRSSVLIIWHCTCHTQMRGQISMLFLTKFNHIIPVGLLTFIHKRRRVYTTNFGFILLSNNNHLNPEISFRKLQNGTVPSLQTIFLSLIFQRNI